MPRRLTRDEAIKRLPENIELLGEYINSKTATEFRCKVCGYEWLSKYENVVHTKYCPKCADVVVASKRTLSYDDIKDRIPQNIKIVGKYKNTKTQVSVQCQTCGGIWDARPYNLFNNSGCPYCYGKKAYPGETDIATTRPDIAKLFKNENETHKYTAYSSHSVDFICPDCGNVINNVISNVSLHGLSCPRCSDGVSFPNKFVRNILSQLKIDYIPEFKIADRFFDNYFKYNGTEYLIEVDGLQHYKTDGLYSENIQGNDEYKDTLARTNGYQLIRIDARESSVDYIKQSIQGSELSSIFDLSTIDWLIAGVVASSSYVKIVADMWNSRRNNETLGEIARSLKVGDTSIRHWIAKAVELGLCEYDPKEESRRIRDHNHQKKRRSVYCEELDMVFDSCVEAGDYIGVTASNVIGVCRGRYHTSKGYHFRYLTDNDLAG